MDLTAAVVIILASLPVPSIDRHEERRLERLQSIAIAITRAAEHATCTGEFEPRSDCRKIASDPNQVAAELIVLADAETALRSNVHRGQCEPHQCDASRYVVRGIVTIVHRARGLWQLHRAPSWSTADWDSLDGASQTATSNGAWVAAKLLAGYRGTCGGGRGAFAGYATGRHCSHPQAQHRADRADWIRQRLAILRPPEQSTSNLKINRLLARTCDIVYGVRSKQQPHLRQDPIMTIKTTTSSYGPSASRYSVLYRLALAELSETWGVSRQPTQDPMTSHFNTITSKIIILTTSGDVTEFRASNGAYGHLDTASPTLDDVAKFVTDRPSLLGPAWLTALVFSGTQMTQFGAHD